ncbi:MAG: 4-hydroxythreonine-4-phosphate dehydrogenase PdxA [Flavobacteriales bacterium]
MKNHKNRIRVGISVGDTNGIGPEIILKTLQKKGLLEFFTPIVFGSTKLFSYYKNALKITANVNGIRSVDDAVDNKINVVNIWKENLQIEMGVATEISGKYAYESLHAATQALKENKVDVLVTAPINKENIQSERFSFPGHTEYLESELEGESLMFMIHDKIKVGLVTNHIPLSEVPEAVSRKKIQKKARLIHKSLAQDFQISKPKIAVLGLNPHNGDGGLIGNEESEKIIPAIEQLTQEGILAFGPFAADSFFGSGEYLNYDAVLAMYHDQGLIPFKNITFGKGVNFTAGLDKIRTSPDHGTAYDIAGQNKAEEISFQQAVFKGVQLFKVRTEFLDLTENALQKQEMEMNYNQYPSNNKEEVDTEELKELE